MLTNELILVILFLTITVFLAKPFGRYISRVFESKKVILSPVIDPIEKLIYKLCLVDEAEQMNWKTYATSFIWLNVIGLIFLFGLLILQNKLPFNPQSLQSVRWDTALNTTVSFVTNTNWQSYSGESTMSYLSQMLGLTVQNFISAAAGIAAFAAVARCFILKNHESIGNFWVDLTRSILYILLPLSFGVSLMLAAGGVIQNFKPYANIQTIEGQTQKIAMGPVASQVAIKQLGSNGGGFFNANSAHPYENPNDFTNLLETFSILFLPISLVFAFGFMVRQRKQGQAIFYAMAFLFLLGLIFTIWSELQFGTLEGRENRFGIIKSALWGMATTVTSNGSVNSMHDSASPLAGLIYMFNMGIGEVIFGGVGVGLIGMLFYIILTMFVAGLMIGRTPEFLGKKLGPFEMTMSVIALLSPCIFLLIFAAIAIANEVGLSGLSNPSSQGLSEILYAYTSAAGNNGSAFAGLSANTPFYNLTLALVILVGRFATVIPALAIAGSLAKKQIVPATTVSFPTTGFIFIAMLVSVVLIMGALTYFPVYTLGPILEHLFMLSGKVF